MERQSVAQLSDRDLLDATARVADDCRRRTADLIALLAEVDARRLYRGEGHSSLFTYCTEALHLSEPAAYARMTAARVARRLPVVRSSVRKLPTPRTSASSASSEDPAPSESALPMLEAPAPASPPPALRVSAPARAVIAPLAPERYLVKITVGQETYDKLERARDLMRHSIPNGDPAAIVDRALTVLIDQLERAKHAKTRRPRPEVPRSTNVRRVPAAVRRIVWARDEGRCAFVGPSGRCTETGFLEFHHVVPFAAGGPTTAENLHLRCRSHNQHEAACYFGPTSIGGLCPDRAGTQSPVAGDADDVSGA